MANQLLGPIPAWGSLTLVGSAGFLLGAVLAGLVARCLSGRSLGGAVAPHRAFVAAEAGEQGSPATEWGGKGAGPGAANAVRASGVSGPLGVGVVVNNSGSGAAPGSAAATTPASSWPAAARVAGGNTGRPHPALQISSPAESAAQSYNYSAAAASSGGNAATATTAAVRDAYELEELDDEWRALVQEVDDRLVAARAPKCGAAERAAVVQALLASAPDESAEDALDRAARLVRAARRGGAAVASGFA